MQGKIRTEWVESILQYQEHDLYGYFVVCEHHFKTEDFCEQNGKKFLQGGSIPSIFPKPQSFEIQNASTYELDNIEFYECMEYDNENNEAMSKDHADTMPEEMDSVILCRKCIDLNMDLMKAKQMISQLQAKLLAQKKALDDHKKKLTRMSKENDNLKTVKNTYKLVISQLYILANASIANNCIYK